MAAARINLIAIGAVTILSGCTGTETTEESLYSDFVVSASNTGALSEPMSSQVPASNNESNSRLNQLQRLHIGPHKVECEGFHLTQCLLNTPIEQTDAEYFYESIEGFEYQWGYRYELLVSVTPRTTNMSDASDQRIQLIKILQQSDYLDLEGFDYIARYAHESIEKTADGQYQLAGIQPMVCEPHLCAALDSALEQRQSMYLNVMYGEQPGDALRLAAVSCVEEQGSFNDTCMSS